MDSKRLRVSLILSNGENYSILLPNVIKGKYLFEHGSNYYVERCIVVVGRENEWYIKCSAPVAIRDAKIGITNEIRITEGGLVSLDGLATSCMMIADYELEDNDLFSNYALSGQTGSICIGRYETNDIICRNPWISGVHAVICWNGNNISITDQNSSNGTIVNNKLINSAELKAGDRIYVMGLQIVVGVGFLSINGKGGKIAYISQKLKPIKSADDLDSFFIHVPSGRGKKELYNRMPRRRIAMPHKEIELENPPISLNSNQIPLMLRMGGSMVMGGSAALSGNYLMLLTSVLFPILTQKYSDNEKRDYEKRRIEKYSEYLESKKKDIEKQKRLEESVLNRNYPPMDRILHNAQKKEKLWERRYTDNDFLSLRVGYGQLPMNCEIKYPRVRFNMDEDPLEMEVQQLANEDKRLENVPILVDFVKNYVCGIQGDHKLILEFVRILILRLAILHSYDEVKMLFLLDEEELDTMSYIRYLPHVWDEQKTIRLIASNTNETLSVCEYLKKAVADDIANPKTIQDVLKTRPYYFVFALSKSLFDNAEVLKDITQLNANCGVSVVVGFDQIPKDASLLFRLHSNEVNRIVHLREIECADTLFVFDSFSNSTALSCMHIMSNTSLKNLSQSYVLPATITFLEMYGVGKVSHLNVERRWRESNPVKSLAVPVGVTTDGSMFYLDLHQKYQGPHGLVAGMTGSGKSEFLITYILSLCVNFHPDEVSFVLIDYKGGGLAGAFDDPTRGIRLPHLVGTITNLDGSIVQRSLISLQSEVMRRQKVFNEVKKAVDEATMDIYQYQKLYRSGRVSQPMPHLFIISDEFAELKQQEPEFMDQLISIARIGRSLGIHLILATQKPSGVVNDQIRSNARMRVCLKVQERSDSMDMLLRPEASSLKETGRFYMQIGYNEFFALGQSAWSGADYTPSDNVIVQEDKCVQFIDTAGQTVLRIKEPRERGQAEGTQLSAIVKHLSAIAKEQGIVSHQLWPEVLPYQIDVRDMIPTKIKRQDIKIVLGLVDDPAEQRQFPLELCLNKINNLMVVGEMGTGKSSVLMAMLYTLVKNYGSSEANFYLLDYSSHLMRFFGQFPHCGAVLDEGSEDQLDPLFEIINSIIAQRKKLFLKLEVDSFEAARKLTELPLIAVFIDNVPAMLQSKKGEKIFYKLQDYFKEGIRYGVQYIVTMNHANDLPMRAKQEIGERICLTLKDKFEYSELLNCKINALPKEIPGRGICKVDSRPLEWHSCIFSPGGNAESRITEFKTELRSLAQESERKFQAKKLPILSETAQFEDFAFQFTDREIPIGYALPMGKPIALPLHQFSTLSYYLGNPKGKEYIINNILYSISRIKGEYWIIPKHENSVIQRENVQQYFGKECLCAPTSESIAELNRAIFKEIEKRRALLEEFCQQEGIAYEDNKSPKRIHEYMYRKTQPIFILIESLADLSKQLDLLTSLLFSRILYSLKMLNVYAISCFESGDFDNCDSALYTTFNSEGIKVLLGGNYTAQRICQLSAVEKYGDLLPFNSGLMYYRNALHPIKIPCGDVTFSSEEDDDDIFKGCCNG